MLKEIRIVLIACLLTLFVAIIYLFCQNNGKASSLPRPLSQRPPPPLQLKLQPSPTSVESTSLDVLISKVTESSKKIPTTASVSLPLYERGHHWKLYGASYIGINMTKQTLREKTMVFSNESMNAKTLSLIERLQSLPISCRQTPHSHKLDNSEKYGKFLEALANYSEFHRQNRRSVSARKLVWYCDDSWCGGLGDRERGLTFTLILAMLTQRVLLFHWQDSRMRNTTYLTPNLIDWTLTETERQWVYDEKNHRRILETGRPDALLLVSIFSHGPTKTNSYSNSRLDLVLQSLVGKPSWIAMKSNMFPSGLVYASDLAKVDWVKKGVARLGLNKLKQFDINKVMGLAFLYLFSFSEEIASELSSARQVLGLTNLPYVGVHVRTGFEGSKDQEEGFSHPKLVKHREQWEAILKCASNQAGKQLKDNSPLFIASDSNLVKELALRTYRDRARGLNNSVIHVDNMRPSRDRDGDFEREGVMSLWVELVLLAEAHSVVMGRSGYPFLAQSLCLIPQNRLFDGINCKPLDGLGM